MGYCTVYSYCIILPWVVSFLWSYLYMYLYVLYCAKSSQLLKGQCTTHETYPRSMWYLYYEFRYAMAIMKMPISQIAELLKIPLSVILDIWTLKPISLHPYTISRSSLCSLSLPVPFPRACVHVLRYAFISWCFRFMCCIVYWTHILHIGYYTLTVFVSSHNSVSLTW